MTDFNYLPVFKKSQIEDIIRDPQCAYTYLQGQSFERIGLDRFYAIANDIERNYGKCYGFSVLDVGCNNGLISDLLACQGNRVLGIDSCIIDTQGRYEELLTTFGSEHFATLQKKELYDLLNETNDSYDFVLLLSVAHQWEYGYANQESSRIRESEISYMMNALWQRTHNAIYYECPINEPGFPENYGISFLSRFIADYHNISIVKVCETVASNGYIRHLYRLSRPTLVSKPNASENQEKKIHSWQMIRRDGGASEEEEIMLVSIKPIVRTCKDLTGCQNNILTARQLWKRIMDNNPEHIVRIHRILPDDRAEISVVHGWPLQEICTQPEWQQRENAFEKAPVLSIEIVKRCLSDLTQGLIGLHNLGIAHGDPFPFNAILHQDGHGTWIDLGNISDLSEQIIYDIYIFIQYTVMYMLIEACETSEALLKDLSELSESRSEYFLYSLKELFDRPRKDIRPKVIADDWIIAQSISHLFDVLAQNEQTALTFHTMPVRSTWIYYDRFIQTDLLRHSIKNQRKFLLAYEAATMYEVQRLRVSKDEAAIDAAEARCQAETVAKASFACLHRAARQALNRAKESAQESALEAQSMIREAQEAAAQAQEAAVKIQESARQAIIRVENEKIAVEKKLQKMKDNLLKPHSIQMEESKMNVFVQAKKEVAEIEDGLKKINQSKSNRYMRMLRYVVKSFASLRPKQIAACVRTVSLFAMGKREAMHKVNEGDLLVQLIGKTALLRQEMEHYAESDQSSLASSDMLLDDTALLDFAPPENRMDTPIARTGKRVAYFTNMLLDWDDLRPRFGGGERYCLMLSRLLKKHGFDITLYQLGRQAGEGEYYGFPVKILPIGKGYSEFDQDASNAFYQISLDYDYVIYNAPELSSARMRPDALAICHGIWFDHNNYGSNIKFRKNKWFSLLYRAFANPQAIVSVDTNSINVIRALWPELATKMTFIPNFADLSLFYPPAEKRNNQKLIVLFPRRSQINRGSRLLESILKQIPHDVSFYWVGEGDAYDTELIKDLAKKDHRLHYNVADFDSMPEWYRKADIAVIPTIACEGTSLSCVEAMACGCATIATNVGGLTDLIIDGHSGISVNPNAEEIARAINMLIEDAQLREKLQREGAKEAEKFSVAHWEERWLKVLDSLKWLEPEQSKKKK